MQFFHNSNVFGSCIIHISYTGCARTKKNNSGAERLRFEEAKVVSRECEAMFLNVTKQNLKLTDNRTLTRIIGCYTELL